MSALCQKRTSRSTPTGHQLDGQAAASHRSLGWHHQHTNTRRDKTDTGHARDPTADWSNFLREYENGEERDPENVHHSSDEQQRHEHPATADAIDSVLEPQQQGARALAAKPAMANQELQRRLALA